VSLPPDYEVSTGLGPPQLVSSLCTEASIYSEPLLRWADKIRAAWDVEHTGIPAPLHRKVWEWTFLIEALHERGVLRPGARGLGFGVGQDPLASVFASLGCEIVATDLDAAAARERGWMDAGQFALTEAELNQYGICSPEDFGRRVTLKTVDMNRLPVDLIDFDFTWSSCAFEHLGSIARGQRFILQQMDCLKPGGIAVHSTEFNVFSHYPTIGWGETVLFRRNDIEWLADRLQHDGHHIVVDFSTGSSQTDRYVDVPPFSGPHLKLQVGSFVSTSLALIIEKSAKVAPASSVERLRHRWRAWGGPYAAQLRYAFEQEVRRGVHGIRSSRH
jgi:SAM-dependent methyltransferase